MSNEDIDAIQWAIDSLDKIQKRDSRTQEERNYLFELDQMVARSETRRDSRAYKRPTE